jgi:hypothetical protein
MFRKHSQVVGRMSPNVLRRASAFANVQNGIEWFDGFNSQTF